MHKNELDTRMFLLPGVKFVSSNLATTSSIISRFTRESNTRKQLSAVTKEYKPEGLDRRLCMQSVLKSEASFGRFRMRPPTAKNTDN